MYCDLKKYLRDIIITDYLIKTHCKQHLLSKTEEIVIIRSTSLQDSKESPEQIGGGKNERKEEDRTGGKGKEREGKGRDGKGERGGEEEGEWEGERKKGKGKEKEENKIGNQEKYMQMGTTFT